MLEALVNGFVVCTRSRSLFIFRLQFQFQLSIHRKIHRGFQGEQTLFCHILLMRKIVFIFRHLRFHLHHIRASLLAQLIQALHLSQHPLAFVQFLACNLNACLSIGSIHIFLHHVDGSIVLNLLHRRG